MIQTWVGAKEKKRIKISDQNGMQKKKSKDKNKNSR